MKNKNFKLITVVCIIIITAVTAAITTGLIINNNIESKIGISYNDLIKDESLNEFLKIYNLINQNFYGELDKNKLIDVAKDSLISYSKAGDTKLMEHVLEDVFNYLGDDYTSYLTGEKSELLESELEGTYKGVGVSITKNKVISVVKDSSAAKEGVRPNDIITKVNEYSITEENSYLISLLISDEKTNNINITVQREDQIINFNLSKSTIDSSVLSSIIENTSIGYIKLSVFSKNSYDNFKNSLNSLENQNVNSLIIDLRDNGGGYLEQATQIASLFLNKGQVINRVESNSGKAINKDLTEECYTKPIIILVNGNSASASEILSAALLENDKAKLVGTKTYGKGTIQQLIETSSGNTAKYTSANWYTPNNNWINKVGIMPNYIIEIEKKYNKDNEIIGLIDTQLNKAIEILSKQLQKKE